MCWFQSNGLENFTYPSCHSCVDPACQCSSSFRARSDRVFRSSTRATAFSRVVSVVSWLVFPSNTGSLMSRSSGIRPQRRFLEASCLPDVRRLVFGAPSSEEGCLDGASYFGIFAFTVILCKCLLQVHLPQRRVPRQECPPPQWRLAVAQTRHPSRTRAFACALRDLWMVQLVPSFREQDSKHCFEVNRIQHSSTIGEALCLLLCCQRRPSPRWKPSICRRSPPSRPGPPSPLVSSSSKRSSRECSADVDVRVPGSFFFLSFETQATWLLTDMSALPVAVRL